eukprot:1199338-Karenia_brevis.AAC.1
MTLKYQRHLPGDISVHMQPLSEPLLMTPRATRDLGLDYTGGNRRATGALRRRVAQARIRAHMVGKST